MDQVPAWFQYMTGGSVFGAAAFYMARLVWRKIAEEGAATQRADGETDIIENLRKEVSRLSNLNEQLSDRLGELQTEIIELRKENADLKSEVQALNIQIQTMQRQRELCTGCPKLLG